MNVSWDQFSIAVCGVASVCLSQSTHASRRRFACLFGLAGQPAWIHATAAAGQWGMLVLSLIYTLAWVRGFWIHWIRGGA